MRVLDAQQQAGAIGSGDGAAREGLGHVHQPQHHPQVAGGLNSLRLVEGRRQGIVQFQNHGHLPRQVEGQGIAQEAGIGVPVQGGKLEDMAVVLLFPYAAAHPGFVDHEAAVRPVGPLPNGAVARQATGPVKAAEDGPPPPALAAQQGAVAAGCPLPVQFVHQGPRLGVHSTGAALGAG